MDSDIINPLEGKPLLYMDWNIFKYIKTPRPSNLNNDRQFKNYIDMLKKDVFLIPYSNAHLIDLSRSIKNDEGSNKLIEDDLSLISSITNNLCITKYFGQSDMSLHFKEAKHFFDEIVKDQAQWKKWNIEQYLFEDLPDDIEKKDKLNEFEQLMSASIVNPLCRLDTQNIPDFLKQMFPENNISLKDLIKNVNELSLKFDSDHSEYKKLRDIINSLYNYDFEANQKYPKKSVDDYLKGKPMGEYFVEHLTQCFQYQNKKYEDVPIIDKLETGYCLLDMYGVAKDKITKKNYFPNIINDALHVVYGAHSSIFVTNDNMTSRKAKLLFRFINIGTNVLNINEFNSLMEKIISAPNNNLL